MGFDDTKKTTVRQQIYVLNCAYANNQTPMTQEYLTPTLQAVSLSLSS